MTDETKTEDAQQTDSQLERGTYEIIRKRLDSHAAELRKRLDQLNHARREVFGSIETKLLSTERITTANNCVPRDMIEIGGRFIFGYNVHLGLRTETQLADVFSVQVFREGAFHEEPLSLIQSDLFENDFRQLYKYYKNTTFARFFVKGPHLFMVFRVGKSVTDIKAFKWLIEGDSLRYMDNRSDHEVKYPPQHEFEWTRTHRDLHRAGEHPHISIQDRVFVETVGGDLTVKVEDNTADGAGIYSEPVDDPDQILDDADIFYSIVGNLILLKIRPYQEEAYRYLVYNEKIQRVTRLDAIENSCVLLPEGHGLIFSNGYYLQNGEHKVYENTLSDLLFERRISSSNGEDDLFVFFNREAGVYVLLSYNMIEQHVDTPITCHGYSFDRAGQLFFFRAGDDPQKHHALQIWQTPYVGDDFHQETQSDSFLFKVGNKDIVRGMAECHEVLNLIGQDESYANLYVDLVKKSSDILDSYFWLNNEQTFHLDQVLTEVKSAASAAVSEFDKVVRVRRETKKQYDQVAAHAEQAFKDVMSKRFDNINPFVECLSDMRRLRGEVISLRELRYIDLPVVDKLEQEVVESTERLSRECVEFLLKENSLTPYEERVQQQRQQIPEIKKVADAKELDEQLVSGSNELEMLIDVVSNLKIDDATQRTQIIDSISAIYSNLNQARAALKKKTQELMAVEGAAEYHAQVKLISQAVVNYLDVCDTPEKCDEYLTKMMVQIEELEGRFAEFDDFVLQLSEKREEVYSAFDNRKLALVEARNKRASTLQSAADRILKGIETRVGNLESVNEINSYFASDLMIEKIRDIVEELTELEDTVKVDDIQSRVKTIREDTVRQLKDRQELFVDGQNVIRMGNHQFTVNTQELDLTTVAKEGQLYFHLTGTNFLEVIGDERLAGTEDLWDQDVVSENTNVYRAEYLAKLFFESLNGDANVITEIVNLEESDRIAKIQEFMAPRYNESYVKGVHDHDAAKIFHELARMNQAIGVLKYPSKARALATVFWHSIRDTDQRKQLATKMQSFKLVRQLFPVSKESPAVHQELTDALNQFNEQWSLFPSGLADLAANYLIDEACHHDDFCASHVALETCRAFITLLERRHHVDDFKAAKDDLAEDIAGVYRLIKEWISAYLVEQQPDATVCVDEVASILFDDSVSRRHPIGVETRQTISGLVGSHPVAEGETYDFDYLKFNERLRTFDEIDVPRYNDFVAAKREIIDTEREHLRLSEFKPRVLTSFVRNRLIDEVYLPMIGDNLAKQMGVAGEQKRTDLMGLLLLISPPGYGKTTLMEYVANRLGITFMKINGPAIGHQVTSLDPVEAPNASAREEVEKLNLSLEMGDNVMIYLDDIQHCNPEFLQKFISLCDGQRKIEGVYKGQTRTYDLRGRKVAVVMAGNPYTESGDKFQIPDMLANRADTYNLGDVIGGSRAAFELSYLENALTSNSTLNQLATRSTKDIYAVIQMAEVDSAEGVELEGNYSVDELNEFINVMPKLMRVRDVVLKVNEQYIASAAQADAYRTEPAFKLQGSYRDMNKMAERVVPIMNDEELETLIISHYENSAQTLTTGAEANLLKFKQMTGLMTDEESKRWEDIKRTFKRNVMLGDVASDDKFGRVIAQMGLFTEGLNDIKTTLESGMESFANTQSANGDETSSVVSINGMEKALAVVASFGESIQQIKESLDRGVLKLSDLPQPAAPQAQGKIPSEIRVINRVPGAFLEVIRCQFDIIQAWMKPLEGMRESEDHDMKKLTAALDEAFRRYDRLINKTDSDTAQAKKKSD